MNTATVRSNTKLPAIFIRNYFPKQYIEKFKAVCKEVIEEPWIYGDPEPEVHADLSECDVIFTLGLMDNLSILDRAPNVRWVQSMSVGIDAMRHKDVINRELIITNTKGCTTIPIAEHTISMMLALAKGVPALVKKEKEPYLANRKNKGVERVNSWNYRIW